MENIQKKEFVHFFFFSFLNSMSLAFNKRFRTSFSWNGWFKFWRNNN